MRQDVVDRADALTREKIAPRAAMYDREGKNPVESWGDLDGSGDMANALLQVLVPAARLVVHDSASRWEGADLAQRGHLANRAKYLTTEIGLHVTSLMPPTMDRMIEGMGKLALGLGGGMFQFSEGNQAPPGPKNA